MCTFCKNVLFYNSQHIFVIFVKKPNFIKFTVDFFHILCYNANVKEKRKRGDNHGYDSGFGKRSCPSAAKHAPFALFRLILRRRTQTQAAFENRKSGLCFLMMNDERSLL